MKIIVTCGHPYSGFQLAYAALTRAGIAQPLSSQRESLSPTALHEKIFKANDLEPPGLGANAPISPGKVWQDLAVDLFVDNMEQKNWGWADAGSVWLLDFWKGLDPRVRFVLVYSTPEFALGNALSDRHASPGETGAVLATWLTFHTEMLRFYNRNPDCCLLVNVAITLHDPGTFIDRATATFGLDLAAPAPGQQADIGSVSAIAATLAKALIEDDHEAYALYRELESAADLADPNALAENAGKRQALDEYTVLLAKIDRATAEASENTQYTNKLKDGQAELAEELQAQSRQLTQTKNEYENLKQQYSKSAQENEIMLLQLHQVQEELELKWQELSAKGVGYAEGAAIFINRFWRKYQPSELVIDFRDEIEGDNWYKTGLDGRWAGPGNVSTVKLPALRNGRYQFYLEIPGAMATEIIAGMEISLNGSGLQTTVDGEGYPVMVYSEFTVEDATQHPVWEFQFKFPKLISPAQHGSSDNRNLAIRASSLKLRLTT